MDHHDHVNLIRRGVASGETWAELGSGRGAFTLALAECLGPGSVIHSVDRDRHALQEQATALARRYPQVALRLHTADFTTPLDLPPLDGILMANSLHFVRDKRPLVHRLRALLRPGGKFLLVEYDVDSGNRWVPYPLSFASWQRLAQEAGFAQTTRLAGAPSTFLRAFYAALSR